MSSRNDKFNVGARVRVKIDASKYFAVKPGTKGRVVILNVPGSNKRFWMECDDPSISGWPAAKKAYPHLNACWAIGVNTELDPNCAFSIDTYSID